MAKVGCWNRQGSMTPSMWCVKGDLESWSNALLMASFPKPLFLRHMAPNFFWLRGPVVISSLKHVATRTRVALAGLSGVYASLSKPSILFISITFRVKEVTLLLGFSWFELMGARLIRAWFYHAKSLSLLTHKFFPQTAPIVGSGFEHSFYWTKSLKPNWPNTMNF